MVGGGSGADAKDGEAGDGGGTGLTLSPSSAGCEGGVSGFGASWPSGAPAWEGPKAGGSLAGKDSLAASSTSSSSFDARRLSPRPMIGCSHLPRIAGAGQRRRATPLFHRWLPGARAQGKPRGLPDEFISRGKSMAALTNKRILLAARPEGMPKPGDFRSDEAPVPAPKEGEVLLRILYLSLDPYMRGRMNAGQSYAAAGGDRPCHGGRHGRRGGRVPASRITPRATSSSPIPAGRPMRSPTARISQARSGGSRPITTALGVLGMPGFTAYAGLLTIGKPKPGETVVVAAASGRRRLGGRPDRQDQGCSRRRHRRRRREMRFRQGRTGLRCLHRSSRARSRRASTRKPAPKGIDVYFENVGGACLGGGLSAAE